jgi:hypothetical protein
LPRDGLRLHPATCAFHVVGIIIMYYHAWLICLDGSFPNFLPNPPDVCLVCRNAPPYPAISNWNTSCDLEGRTLFLKQTWQIFRTFKEKYIWTIVIFFFSGTAERVGIQSRRQKCLQVSRQRESEPKKTEKEVYNHV